MCYFIDTPVVKVHELTEDKAIIAYKRLGYRSGYFHSPIYNVIWEKLRVSNMYGKPGIQKDATSGIYCFATRRAASHHSNDGLVVALRIWGRVVEHEYGAYSPRRESYSTRGYRAQHAKIVAVEVAGPSQRQEIRRYFDRKTLRFLESELIKI